MCMRIAKGRWFLLSEICSLTVARIPHTICMLKVLNLLAKTSGVGMETRGIEVFSPSSCQVSDESQEQNAIVLTQSSHF